MKKEELLQGPRAEPLVRGGGGGGQRQNDFLDVQFPHEKAENVAINVLFQPSPIPFILYCLVNFTAVATSLDNYTSRHDIVNWTGFFRSQTDCDHERKEKSKQPVHRRVRKIKTNGSVIISL